MNRLQLALVFALLSPVSKLYAHDLRETAPLFLAEYLKIHEALAGDRTEGVVQAASKISETARSMAGHASSNEAPLYQELARTASAVQGNDIEALRTATKALSLAVDRALRAAKVEGWYLFYCPMAEGYWIQKDTAPRNPYYGKSMLRCGEIVPAPKGA